MSKALMHATLVDAVADSANARQEATEFANDTEALKVRVAALEAAVDNLLEVVTELVAMKK